MSATRQRPFRRLPYATVALLSAGVLAAGCTSNTPEDTGGGGGGNEAASANDEPGETVTIGFSAPAADHGWMAGITEAARAEAEKYEDVELVVAEGTNDVSTQISQVETFINDGVDAIVLLPFDGAAMTPVALQAMEAGIPVINVDRQFDSPFAARATILGDNYGMGVSAGTYVCEQLGDNPDAVVAEIAGIDSLPLTQERSQGFADALADCGLNVDNRVAADFTVEGGEEAASNLLQAAPQIDAIWNHDDDQGVGVLAAIQSAGRDEFFMVGGAGSANAMRAIQEGNSVLQATVIYPSTQGADGIALARLVAQDKNLSDVASQEVPRQIVLNAPVVTADNVDQYIDSAFES
ncbi:monosaccharide ABC transporter substrate-binding protein, CUT2 family (TC 3.A.1.2.-) [Geodermatophilus amargosae]|uniref:Monosaccharide ABC transporter substrate-binding protein, CUT2 family (TC 3.A.1.2.-) n=1 Tax=Geodermatophilus amargosae TaxID=1296565 RepID=A0A1I6ZU39_9ACTN|nr:substrate-binding domain-containing protein [Geodermatophilus amargosae]SFT66198.1 monosaccharide ABC transporter substrate-binding protein, CUT2 family (TC 3.A.1.2.-) [Geodermatophilus amargosae]